MNITIEPNGAPLTDELNSQIINKVARLEHYFDHIIDAVVYLHNEPTYRQVEVKLNVPMETLFVRENGETYPAALDIAFDSMKRKIIKYKERTLKVPVRGEAK